MGVEVGMSATARDRDCNMAISREAHEAFFRVSGQIRSEALRLAEEIAKSAGRELVSVDDIKAGFRQAVVQAVGPSSQE